MYRRNKLLAPLLSAALVPVAGCTERDRRTERWATTENTNVAIDWDRVNEAYRTAEGPQDLERKINEIYQGSETISIAVQDRDARTQEVIGFFDRNHSGSVDTGEKIFTIRRQVTDQGTAQVQTVGHGPYAYYHSPLLTIASGMLMGSMLSRALTPGYAPAYARPYVTSSARASELSRARPSFRQRAPSATQSRPRISGSGRHYGGGPVMPRGGGRFGLRRGARPAPVRLDV